MYQAYVSSFLHMIALKFFRITLPYRYFPFLTNGKIELQGGCGRSPENMAAKSPSQPWCVCSPFCQEMGTISPSLNVDWPCDMPWANNAAETTFGEFWAQALQWTGSFCFLPLEIPRPLWGGPRNYTERSCGQNQDCGWQLHPSYQLNAATWVNPG